MTESVHCKKRKRETYQDGKTTLSMSTAPSALGPVIVAFPALQPSQSTAFTCYVKPQNTTDIESVSQKLSPQNSIIAGETDSVEFHTNYIHPRNPACQYMIGVHDQTTNKVILRHAPLHILTRNVKAFKSTNPFASYLAAEERDRARNVLGEAFGSKKARQAIRASERNRVDISAMEGVADRLQESIDAGTAGLPSQEAAKALADENRPIPPYNINAKLPDEIYALHDIIPESEFNSMDVARFLSASDQGSRTACLPYSRSSWINEHLAAEFTTKKPNKANLKILYYISAMFLFRNTYVSDKVQLQKRMSSVPHEVIDGLLARFTERSRNSTQDQVTKQAQTLLLTHMFALCLRLDHYAVDPTPIAADLSLSVTTVITHFRQLGCRVEALTATDRSQLGFGPSSEKEPKRCILRIPFDFPKQRVHKRKKAA